MHPPAPCGAGLHLWRHLQPLIGFQSTRPVRGGTDKIKYVWQKIKISIHPPRAGRDAVGLGPTTYRLTFQSTRPVRGGTGQRCRCNHRSAGFQSTRPVRGGTTLRWVPMKKTSFQSTRPVRGGTILIKSFAISAIFQSTRPVRGGTCTETQGLRDKIDFNPPAPCGAGLGDQAAFAHNVAISIHPPRAGRDLTSRHPKLQLKLFQSTRPVRGGTRGGAGGGTSTTFQSTRPVRGGTIPLDAGDAAAVFQSTRPVRGGTPMALCLRVHRLDFNPPAPCGAGPAIIQSP